MPTVSIIIPVYKAEHYLDACMRSVVGQSCTDLEILLVDDGSPDRSPEMCDAWAAVIHQQYFQVGTALPHHAAHTGV